MGLGLITEINYILELTGLAYQVTTIIFNSIKINNIPCRLDDGSKSKSIFFKPITAMTKENVSSIIQGEGQYLRSCRHITIRQIIRPSIYASVTLQLMYYN